MVTKSTPDAGNGYNRRALKRGSMLRTIERRLSWLEGLIPIPLTAERFVAKAHQLASRSGVSVWSALVTLAGDLSVVELETILGEPDHSKPAKREAAKRRALMLAGPGASA
jgi:hypothetical protein